MLLVGCGNQLDLVEILDGLSSKERLRQFVVVDPLASHAILSLNFLMEQQAAINLAYRTLHLRARRCSIPLQQPKTLVDPASQFLVRSACTVEIPPGSYLDISNNVSAPAYRLCC